MRRLGLPHVVRERRVPRGQQRPFGAIALDEFSSKHTLDQTEVFFRTKLDSLALPPNVSFPVNPFRRLLTRKLSGFPHE